MRVLIVTAAVLACAYAAPSGHLLQPIIATFPASIPTVASGDIQAAAIDAQVQAQDQARALTDQYRDAAELAVLQRNAKVAEINDLNKQRAEEAFWAAEDQKWKALNAAQIAQAEIDGNAADASAKIASAAYKAVIVPAPVITQLNPIYVAPGVLTSINPEEPILKDAKPEEQKKEELPTIDVKTAETTSQENKEDMKDEKKDGLKIDGQDLTSFIQNPEKAKLLLQTTPYWTASLALQPSLKYQQLVQPLTYFAPTAYSSSALAQYYSSPIIAPAIWKTW